MPGPGAYEIEAITRMTNSPNKNLSIQFSEPVYASRNYGYKSGAKSNKNSNSSKIFMKHQKLMYP